MSEKKEKIGILGYGQVGKALAKFYKNPKIKDLNLNRDDILEGVEILHICIPWNEKFIKIVAKEIQKVEPRVTIIHSTVLPYTTKKLVQLTNQKIVHSPVRGTHPELFEGIKTFVKYIGTDNKEAGELAKRHFQKLGIKTKVFMPSVTTELGKLFDTSYYGLCIAFHGEMKRVCERFQVNFDEVVTDFNKTYNEGYMKLGKPHVIRPVLYPPRNGIGGHCVLENIILVRESCPEIYHLCDLVLKMGKDKSFLQEEKLHFNKVWLYAEYWGKGKTIGEIAKEIGASEKEVLWLMKKNKIPLRNKKWLRRQISKILKIVEEM